MADTASGSRAALMSVTLCAGDLAKAVQGCGAYLEALNGRGRLELLLASPTISMDLQDRLLDLADGVAALQRCQIQARLVTLPSLAHHTPCHADLYQPYQSLVGCEPCYGERSAHEADAKCVLEFVKAAVDVLDNIEFVSSQLRVARIHGDTAVEQLVSDLLQQVTLRHMRCANTPLLNGLVRLTAFSDPASSTSTA